jgi:hypothetical protein
VANTKLTSRITELKNQGIDIDKEVYLLKSMRKRVTELCLTPLYLEVYRYHLVSHGFFIHQNDNKLRDVDNVYTDNGHAFSYNKDIIYSFDICGNCEAHAILFSIENGLATSVENGKQTIFNYSYIYYNNY